MARVLVVSITVVLTLACAFVGVWCTPVGSSVRGQGPLQRDLRRAVALTDAVVAAAGPGAEVLPSPYNADLATAERLRDNHSVEDHGVGPVTHEDLFANKFEDCDHAKNVLFDGWRTRYVVDIILPTPQATDALLQSVRERWEAMGYRVERVGPEAPVLATDVDPIERGGAELGVRLEATDYLLIVDRDRRQASAGAAWNCVSAG